MAKTREGGRAYLLITFDLPNQRMLKTEEVVGRFDGEFQPVAVDWGRVISMINVMADKHSPKRPWSPKDDVPIPPIGPPWNRASVDEDDDSEEPEEPPNV
jgi:hypothetical protein